MIYRVECRELKLQTPWSAGSAQEWLFGWLCFMLSEKPVFVISGYRFNESVAHNLEQAGLRITQNGSAAMLEKSQAVSSAIETSFSAMPFAAIPFAIACAALGLQADIRGLSGLMDYQGADMISPLQRALFRLGIHTDFCDRSKLKVFGDKPIRIGHHPADVSKSSLLSLLFIPLVIRLGPMEMVLDKASVEKYASPVKELGFVLTEKSQFKSPG